MDSIERSESVDGEGGRSIFLEFGRKWPKYVVAWSVRERVGDSDFPVEAGTIEAVMPPEGEAEKTWEELRQQALEQARLHLPDASEAVKPRGSFFARFLGRN